MNMRWDDRRQINLIKPLKKCWMYSMIRLMTPSGMCSWRLTVFGKHCSCSPALKMIWLFILCHFEFNDHKTTAPYPFCVDSVFLSRTLVSNYLVYCPQGLSVTDCSVEERSIQSSLPTTTFLFNAPALFASALQKLRIFQAKCGPYHISSLY